MSEAVVIGIDIGTSGARAVAMNAERIVVAQTSAPYDAGNTVRDPKKWWAAVSDALSALLYEIPRDSVRAIAVDGTSGTVLPIDSAGQPLAEPLMYNDAVADRSLLDRIKKFAPADSGAHGATSGLAKALKFLDVSGLHRIVHQADWIAGNLSGRFDLTDENNALKTGYDPIERRWPEWIAHAGVPVELLPEVREPGSMFGPISANAAREFGLPAETLIVAGTTDGCASFLATGANRPGDGVTALGSSLTLKLLSDRPIFAPSYGIYSHRIGDMWLAGGASNSGGRVLAKFFDTAALQSLSSRIDPQQPTGLDYYPLLEKGERFPVADPDLAPRMEPHPGDDALFLQGLFEGTAAIEKLGYRRLSELGAPPLASLRSVGGGAVNSAWTAIRQSALGVPFLEAASTEAAAGTARLSLKGAIAAGVMQ
ncbi:MULTISPECIES: FGGY-family carbohydrate kinase [Mesorhizobium]|uniref:Carbohydrate kinase n=1 Tax=Mesorhizobium denitrificans TaxID=2294114 RepID=A0A371XD54_9HYPH|nr:MULTISPECIES: FGGY-family carbohydrate kinase [Mesorhizobium]RFC67167.1 carbohydrate kinase [Mesorhizobium denitrificans]